MYHSSLLTDKVVYGIMYHSSLLTGLCTVYYSRCALYIWHMDQYFSASDTFSYFYYPLEHYSAMDVWWDIAHQFGNPCCQTNWCTVCLHCREAEGDINYRLSWVNLFVECFMRSLIYNIACAIITDKAISVQYRSTGKTSKPCPHINHVSCEIIIR